MMERPHGIVQPGRWSGGLQPNRRRTAASDLCPARSVRGSAPFPTSPPGPDRHSPPQWPHRHPTGSASRPGHPARRTRRRSPPRHGPGNRPDVFSIRYCITSSESRNPPGCDSRMRPGSSTATDDRPSRATASGSPGFPRRAAVSAAPPAPPTRLSPWPTHPTSSEKVALRGKFPVDFVTARSNSRPAHSRHIAHRPEPARLGQIDKECRRPRHRSWPRSPAAIPPAPRAPPAPRCEAGCAIEATGWGCSSPGPALAEWCGRPPPATTIRFQSTSPPSTAPA